MRFGFRKYAFFNCYMRFAVNDFAPLTFHMHFDRIWHESNDVFFQRCCTTLVPYAFLFGTSVVKTMLFILFFHRYRTTLVPYTFRFGNHIVKTTFSIFSFFAIIQKSTINFLNLALNVFWSNLIPKRKEKQKEWAYGCRVARFFNICVKRCKNNEK